MMIMVGSSKGTVPPLFQCIMIHDYLIGWKRYTCTCSSK